MANKTMHHVVIGDDTFELVDEAGREETTRLKEDITQSVDDLKNALNKSYISTRNIFDGTWIPFGIDLDTGDDKPSATTFQHTDYISISQNTYYTISSSMTDAYGGQVFYYDSNKEFLSRSDLAYGFYPKTVVSPSYAAYMRIQESINATNTDFQVESGKVATTYIPHRVISDLYIENGDSIAVITEKTNECIELIIGKNLFFSEWSESGNGLNLDTGKENNMSSNRRTGFVEVEEQKTYTASCVLSDAPSVYMFYYDESKAFLNYYQTSYGFYPKTFTTPANTKYVRVLHSSGGLPTDYQIESGSTATTYEAPYKEYAVPASKVRGVLPDRSISISGKKWLFLGDSITANLTSSGWVYKFKELVEANENSYIQAVGGATWCDGEPNVVYNGKPYQSQNYVGNQVAWCQSIGFPSDAFDCIIISAGTNDTNTDYPNDSQVEEQFYNGNTLKTLSTVDRTTWAGCIRWTVETLRGMYPNAVIVLLTPLQRKVAADGTTITDMYPTIRQKRETIVKMAHRMGTYCINMDEVNITDMDSSDFADGLHPNNAGATKMANYVFRKIMPIMCDYSFAE